MDDATFAFLSALNRDFYAGFAEDFARTRRRWPLGFERILPYLRPAANVLDLGCGNGRLLAFLAARGWRGCYVGVDGSEGLLAEARHAATLHPQVAARFIRSDLATGHRLDTEPAQAVAALAILHHIPSAARRARFLADCAALLRPDGHLILSVWQFLASPRLRARIMPWEGVGLRADDVEPGDYLLAWGQGAAGRRYCAYIDETTLGGLASAADLKPIEIFYADGREGNLNLYGVFTAR